MTQWKKVGENAQTSDAPKDISDVSSLQNNQRDLEKNTVWDWIIRTFFVFIGVLIGDLLFKLF